MALANGQELTSKDLYTKTKGFGYNKSEKTMTRIIKGNNGNARMLKKVNDLNEWIDMETTSVDARMKLLLKAIARSVCSFWSEGSLKTLDAEYTGKQILYQKT